MLCCTKLQSLALLVFTIESQIVLSRSHTAAIVTERTAEMYGLEILDRNIQDNKAGDITRYLLLSRCANLCLALKIPQAIFSSVSNRLRCCCFFIGCLWLSGCGITSNHSRQTSFFLKFYLSLQPILPSLSSTELAVASV